MNEREDLIDLLIHDLRGPLSVASTDVSNLLHKPDRYGSLTERQRRSLERIWRNTRKAQTLLREMLEISRSELGLFREERFPIDEALRESLLDVLEISASPLAEKVQYAKDGRDFRRILEAHGIFIDIKGRYRTTPFFQDQRKVQQILRNLLSNALKYRQKRVNVSISGELDLVVSVGDDGRGIPQEEQEIIFDRFVRLKDAGSPDVPGLGLGLTGVKTLVEAMGGRITLVSREGFGTSFRVRIPPLHSHRQREGKMKESVLSNKRILAVDDEPDVLMVLEEEILDACPDCRLDKAATFEEATQLLASWTYDLVILDIMGVRGFELLEEAVNRTFPVAMLTAHALTPEALKRSIELGARSYLPKEKLGEIVPFLEDVLTHELLPGWKRLFEKLGGFFNAHFGPDWQKAEAKFWQEFNEKVGVEKWVITR
jgi:CheY-like chemotaxis protein